MTTLEDFEELEAPDEEEMKTISHMANELLTIRELMAELQAKLQALSAEERQLSQHDLPEKMKEIGVMDFTMEDGSRLAIKHKVKASLSKARREEGFAWLREHGHGALIKPKTVEEHIHHQTLTAFIKEQLDMGTAIPTQLFGVYEFDETIIKS